jgi:hypothetical protein
MWLLIRQEPAVIRFAADLGSAIMRMPFAVLPEPPHSAT